jgi:hypothetical protein
VKIDSAAQRVQRQPEAVGEAAADHVDARPVGREQVEPVADLGVVTQLAVVELLAAEEKVKVRGWIGEPVVGEGCGRPWPDRRRRSWSRAPAAAGR